MKTIYLVRHGETQFNKSGLLQGQSDSPLTELGVKQAERVKDWFTKNKIKIDSVYSSSLKRASDTAEIIANIACKRCDNLKEMCLGKKEARPVSEFAEYPNEEYFVKYGGEDIRHFRNRIYKAVERIAIEDDTDTILIISHGLAIKNFLKAINYKGEVNCIIPNCGIIHLEYENNKFKVKGIIDSSL